MRNLVGFVLLIVAAIGVALFANHLHPGGDLPPAEQQADQDARDAEQRHEAEVKRLALVDNSPGAFDAVKAGALHATLTFEGKPPMEIELYPAAAPQSVAQIAKLIKKGFYTGIKVHRVETGKRLPNGAMGMRLFQFGDPQSALYAPSEFDANTIGSHGTGASIPLEIKLPHLKYTIGMAREQAENSGDCQMYVNTGDNRMLDGNYCIFGRIVGGQEVVPTIALGDKIKSFTLH